MRGSLLTRVKRLESMAEGRKAASPAIGDDDKPLSPEEQHQLDEADAALSAHGQGDLIPSLSERTRIRLAPYAASVQIFDECMEERHTDTALPGTEKTDTLAPPPAASSPPIPAAPSPIAPPAVSTATIFTI